MLRFHDFVENTIDRERNYMARSFRLLIFLLLLILLGCCSRRCRRLSLSWGENWWVSNLLVFFRGFFTSPFVLAFLRRRSRCNSVFYVCFLVHSRAFALDG